MSRRPVRFVHAADLHLDSPLRGLRSSDAELAVLVHEATFRSFDRICDLARRQRVDFVLVAGDVFDEATGSVRARLHFRRRLGELARDGIPSFVVFGNHDHEGLWQGYESWPEGVTVFGSREPASHSFETDAGTEVTVHGISFGEQRVEENLVARLGRRSGGGVHIGLVHANVGASTGHENYAPCTLEDLASRDYDYWALGHVHQHLVLRPSAPAVVYPGNSQGRHVRETGPKGCVLVSLTPGAPPTIEHVATDSIRWDRFEVDLSGVETVPDAVDVIQGEIDTRATEADRPLALRIRLRGRAAVNRPLRSGSTLEDLRSELLLGFGARLLHLDLRLETSPDVDREALLEGEGFLGDLLRMRAEVTGDPTKLREWRSEIADLFEHTNYRKDLEELLAEDPEGTLARWLEDAESLLVDRLAPEDA